MSDVGKFSNFSELSVEEHRLHIYDLQYKCLKLLYSNFLETFKSKMMLWLLDGRRKEEFEEYYNDVYFCRHSFLYL